MSTVHATGFAILAAQEQRPVSLAMQRLHLTGKVLPLGARLWVRHDFESNETSPIEVVYAFAQPREATLRRFHISGHDFSVNSELRPTEQAVKDYEHAVSEGSLAGLARVYRDGIVNLNVGNIRPHEHVTVLLELACGVELHDDGLRLRFPFTLSPAYHAQARTFEVEPGVGELELPDDQFSDVILPRYRQNGTGLHEVAFSLDVAMGSPITEIASPSHSLRVENTDTGSRVSLACNSSLPDRDLVLDVKKKSTGVSLFCGRDDCGKGRVAAILPSTEFGKLSDTPRRIVIVLDRSGSMEGAPITQAKRAIEACLAVLNERDSFGIVAFDNVTETFTNGLMDATSDKRRDASAFLAGIDARGGTELASALETAAGFLHGEGGDILVFTDGQVFATETVLARVRATSARVHVLGIGSASQDRFLAQLASHTGGVSRFMTPQERVDMAALELFAAIGRPVACDVQVSIAGAESVRISPSPAKQVFSGTPFSFFADLAGAGTAALTITWQNEGQQRTWSAPLRFDSSPVANTLKLLQGARMIADLESRDTEPFLPGAASKREASRARELLRAVSEEYGLASREMALVAIVKRAGDVTGDIPRTQVVPVGMPQGMEAAAYFAKRTLGFSSRTLSHRVTGDFTATFDTSSAAPDEGDFSTALFSVEHALSQPAQAHSDSKWEKIKRTLLNRTLHSAPATLEDATDILMAIAGRLEPDGGMPGKTEQERLVHTLLALLFFASQGHSNAGPFRRHVAKMLSYLSADMLRRLAPDHHAAATDVRDRIGKGKHVSGEYLPFAREIVAGHAIDANAFWKELEQALSTNTV